MKLPLLSLLCAVLGWSPALADVPANLVAEGIPTIPAEVMANAAPYLDFRAAVLQSWHPQRREMLITTRFASTPQLHLVRQPGGARKQLTFSSEPVGSASFQPGSGDSLIYSQDAGGGEFYQLYRYDCVRGRTTLLTDGKSRNTGPVWSRDGRRLAWTSTRRNGKDNDVWIMDPDKPSEAKLLAELNGGGWAVTDWSPDGTRLALTEYLSANLSHLWLMDSTTGRRERLTPEGGPAISRSGGQFSQEGQFLYFTSDEAGEFRQLGRMSLTERKWSAFTASLPWDVEAFDLSPDGKTVAFCVNEAGRSVLYLTAWSKGIQQGVEQDLPSTPLRVGGIPNGVITGLEWHSNGQDLGFSLTSAKSPADAWSVSITSGPGAADRTPGPLQRWTESETGGLNPDTFQEPELITVKSFDGLALSGFLYRPDPAKFPGNRPVLINIHGGPEGQSRPIFQARNNYWMNQAGIALFYPNVRGSEGSGKTFLALDNGFKREDSVKDIGAFLDWIATDPACDAARVAVTGGSYGGYMSLACMIQHGARLRCGIDIVGISNFLTFLRNTQDYRRELRRVEYGDERDEAMRAFLEKISPTAHATEIQKPLFIVQGQNDPRVPVTEATQMAAAVRQAGTPVWFLLAKDEGHGFAKKPNADFQFHATILFLQEHLLK
jgi:dipeptidyl aminopeptidase/acylaminoacyl peptidase